MKQTNFLSLDTIVQDRLIENLRGLPHLKSHLRRVLEDLDPMVVYKEEYTCFIAPEYAEAFFVLLVKNQSKTATAQ